ncbi:MAG: hypothetical protein MUF15_21000 [Acidobacteria bacterium]|nr:hypothetical protein [Acidobacteriota bacterium]
MNLLPGADIKPGEGIKIISDSHTVICSVATRGGDEGVKVGAAEEAEGAGKPEEAGKDKAKTKAKE